MREKKTVFFFFHFFGNVKKRLSDKIATTFELRYTHKASWKLRKIDAHFRLIGDVINPFRRKTRRMRSVCSNRVYDYQIRTLAVFLLLLLYVSCFFFPFLFACIIFPRLCAFVEAVASQSRVAPRRGLLPVFVHITLNKMFARVRTRRE